MDAICKKCSKEFSYYLKTCPKTVCDSCTKARIDEFQYRYHFSVRKSRVTKLSRLRTDVKLNHFIGDHTYHGFKTKRTFQWAIRKLKSEGINIKPTPIYQLG